MPSVTNDSTVLTDDEVRTMVAACDKQMKDHYCPAWGMLPWDLWFSTNADGYIHCTIVDEDVNVPDALAYHDYVQGRPIMVVLAKTILDNGGSILGGGGSTFSVSGALSHEYVETRSDAWTTAWNGPADDGFTYAHETADPVQNDEYDLDGVAVSNFVLPHWFAPGSDGPYDYLDTLSKPFQVKNGYAIREEAFGETQVFGEKPAWHGWRSLSRRGLGERG